MEKHGRLASPWFNPNDFIAHRRINEAEADISALRGGTVTAERQIMRLLELDRDRGPTSPSCRRSCTC